MKRFFHQLRRVHLNDIVQIWKLPVAAICALFYRMFHRDMWIVCEDKNEARDNGYWFYKYVKTVHPEQECVYAISRNSPDIYKIKALGDWVEFGSLKHWIIYLASSKKISSQKSGNPDAAVFYFLEVYGILKDKRVFLQHGVIINNLKWLYYDATRMKRFICGVYPEYKYVKKTYGYPDKNIKYTGLCRFDGLHDNTDGKRIVLIMPTWREWIADEDYRLKEYEGTTIIPHTNYFRTWIDFIKDDRIKLFAEKYNVSFIFFPHRDMQKYIKYFPKSNKYIEIADATKYDVQQLMKDASMMLTDYSSVFFDMLYMKKPVAFYQFDYELFRKAQYGKGYFDYLNNPFARSFRDKDSVFAEIEKYICADFIVSESYLKAHKQYFRLYDTDNCKRVYEVVKRLK